MRLIDLIRRQAVPAPWSEGEKIPWNDPDFSQRMLREHLSQEHDAASRRFPTIDRHVAWIHEHLLSSQPTRILDLGCGPGLYAARLARLGHTCVGIDFSPASIAYAADWARADGLPCTYLEHDIRSADYGSGYGLVMQIFGELNVFRPSDARRILEKAYRALQVGGALLLEVHTYAVVHRLGHERATWYSADSGLFSAEPHLCLMESFWDEEQAVATERYFVVNGASGAVTRYAASTQAYTDEQYRSLLEETGFGEIAFYPHFGAADSEQVGDLFAIVSRKRI
jgi:SAM-dependent methyltransferase